LTVGEWNNQKNEKIAETKGVCIIAHAQKGNVLSDLYKILRDGRYLRHNDVCKFL